MAKKKSPKGSGKKKGPWENSSETKLSPFGEGYDFTRDPPQSPTLNDDEQDETTQNRPAGRDHTSNSDDDEDMNNRDDTDKTKDDGAPKSRDDEDEEDCSEDEDSAQRKPPAKRQKKGTKHAATDAKVAEALFKELKQLLKYDSEADRTTRFTNSKGNVGAITMEGKFVVVIHSATHHVAEPGEESDDEHHDETVGHSGAAGVAVHIPQGALGKKAKLKGVTPETVSEFYKNPNNYKKFLVVDGATDEQKDTYTDVIVFPFVPSLFRDWLLEKKRTPFEFYNYILMFLRNCQLM